MSKILKTHLLCKKFKIAWSSIFYFSFLINISYILVIISSIMFSWYDFSPMVIYSTFYSFLILRLIKVFIYLFPWKYSYWNFRKIHPLILSYIPNGEFELEIFSDFILGKKVARGAAQPLMRSNYIGMKSKDSGIAQLIVNAFFYVTPHKLRKWFGTANKKENFEADWGLLRWIIMVFFFDPFFWASEEMYRFTKLVSFINYVDNDTSNFMKNWYTTSKTRKVPPMRNIDYNGGRLDIKPTDRVSLQLVVSTKWNPEIYPGINNKYIEFNKYARDINY